jgi:glycerate kinase
VPTVVAAPDKFRGTATAAQVAAAIAEAARDAGWDCRQLPLADGGDGLLDVLGGANRFTVVTGPTGDPVRAGWRLGPDRGATIESALASGLVLTGGAAGNDPVTATSRGTGELIAAALADGASRVVVGLGGSAMTDGGLGALEALEPFLPLTTPLIVLCDVRTGYLEAARVFAPQKGATPQRGDLLTERLANDAEYLAARFGVDVRSLPGAGAAGGLAGALAAAGGVLRDGFSYVAEASGFERAVSAADLVVTGEGRLDAASFDGKVVGGVVAMARAAGVPVLIVAGSIADEPAEGIEAVSLEQRFGLGAALADPLALIRSVVAGRLPGTRAKAPPGGV